MWRREIKKLFQQSTVLPEQREFLSGENVERTALLCTAFIHLRLSADSTLTCFSCWFEQPYLPYLLRGSWERVHCSYCLLQSKSNAVMCPFHLNIIMSFHFSRKAVDIDGKLTVRLMPFSSEHYQHRNLCWLHRNLRWLHRNLCWLHRNLCWLRRNRCWLHRNRCWIHRNRCWLHRNRCWLHRNRCWLHGNRCWLHRF